MSEWAIFAGGLWLSMGVVSCNRPTPPPVVQPAPLTTPPPPVTPTGPMVLIDGVTGLGLFGDEVNAANRLIAEWAQQRGYRVVSVDEAERQFTAARLGLDAQGKACGRPLAR